MCHSNKDTKLVRNTPVDSFDNKHLIVALAFGSGESACPLAAVMLDYALVRSLQELAHFDLNIDNK